MIYLNVSYAQKDEARRRGARWDRQKMLWYYPGDVLPSDLEKFLPALYANAEAEQIILDIPFHCRELASEAGARWNAENKVYYFEKRPDKDLPPSLTGFEPKIFSWEEKIQRELNNQKLSVIAAEKRITLKPHQVDATKEIFRAYRAGYPGFLLADDVGLGKTIAGWSAILRILENSDSRWKILIVCPLGVVTNWRSTIQWMGTHHHIEELLIINYDRLAKIFQGKPRKGTKKISRKELARRGDVSQDFDLLLFDESHYLKNLTSMRTKFALKLYQSARMILWLSATAGQNPLELGYLFPLLAKRTGDDALNAKDFEDWCSDNLPGVNRNNFGAWTWQGGTEEVEQVHQLLFGSDKNQVKTALRRRASDIEGWPEINRIVHFVELDGQAKRLYQLAWKEFKEAMAGIGRMSRQQAAIAKSEAVIHLRQKASLLKVEETVELCLELFENGRQVAISCEFIATMDAIERALIGKKIDHARIDGQRTRTSEFKERERLRYQQGEAQVILFSVVEGISLHQGEINNNGNDVPRAQIDHDLRWSAIQTHQIDGRSHRDGKFAQVYWVVAKETIDIRVAEVLLTKLDQMARMQGDSTEDFEDILDHIQK